MLRTPLTALGIGLLSAGLASGSAMASGPVVIKVHPEELVEKPSSPLVAGNFLELGFGRHGTRIDAALTQALKVSRYHRGR